MGAIYGGILLQAYSFLFIYDVRDEYDMGNWVERRRWIYQCPGQSHIHKLVFGVGVVGEAMEVVVFLVSLDVLVWATLAEVGFIGSELEAGGAAELRVVADSVTPSNVDPGASPEAGCYVVVSTAGRVAVVGIGIGVLSAVSDVIATISSTSGVARVTEGGLRKFSEWRTAYPTWTLDFSIGDKIWLTRLWIRRPQDIPLYIQL